MRALTLLNIKELDNELVEQTLSTLMKYEADVRKAHQELKAFLAEKQAAAAERRRQRKGSPALRFLFTNGSARYRIRQRAPP